MRLASPFVECNDVINDMHPMHLAAVDLNLAVVLHALLTERSVSRAARSLGLSQSATSHALARLRTLLDDPLVVRTASGLAPTPRADAMAQQVASALASLEQAMLAAPSFDPATARRTFHVGAADYAEFVLLPPLLARIAHEAPEVDLWIRPLHEDISAQLRRGDLDVAINLVRPDEHAAGIRNQKLFDERFVAMVRKGHPLSRKRLTIERYVAAHHAFIAPRGRPGGVVDDALAAMGLQRRVALAIPHFLVAPHVIARTDLVLTVAERIAEAFASLLPLTILTPPLALPGFTMSMLWHERSEHDPGQAWLRSRLAAVAAEMVKGPAPGRSTRRKRKIAAG